MYPDEPFNATKWMQQLEAGQLNDPIAEMASHLQAARPPSLPMPTALKAALKSKLLGQYSYLIAAGTLSFSATTAGIASIVIIVITGILVVVGQGGSNDSGQSVPPLETEAAVTKTAVFTETAEATSTLSATITLTPTLSDSFVMTATETSTATPTATPTATLTPIFTPTIRATVTLTLTLVPSTTADACTGVNPHPKGEKLAQEHGVSYAEIMARFCAGYGFGEIDLGYTFAEQSGLAAEEVFALRESGLGWGRIRQELGLTAGNGHKNDQDSDGAAPDENSSHGNNGNGNNGNNGNGNNGGGNNGNNGNNGGGNNGNGNNRGGKKDK